MQIKAVESNPGLDVTLCRSNIEDTEGSNLLDPHKAVLSDQM